MTTSSMTPLLIEPRDPLILRDGRPFAAGGRARSLPSVPPSVTSGTLRTLAGMTADGEFDPERIPELLSGTVHGPLLVEIGEDDALTWLLPPPRDAALTEQGGGLVARRLHLEDVGGSTDLNLLHLMPTSSEKVRASAAAWSWSSWERWLSGADSVPLGSPGRVPAPTREDRIHVSIDARTGTATDRLLFQTSALNFMWAPAPEHAGLEEDVAHADPDALAWKRLGLLLWTSLSLAPGPTLTRMGGEGRLAAVRTSTAAPPTVPATVMDGILDTGGVTVYLLTPACFQQGWRPGWLLNDSADLQVTLRAAATDRPLILSGWDYKERRAKPTRRFSPAGCAYYLHLEGPAQARRAWVEQHWFQCVSDDPQDRRDGFGLALLGTWNPAEVRRANLDLTDPTADFAGEE